MAPVNTATTQKPQNYNNSRINHIMRVYGVHIEQQ